MRCPGAIALLPGAVGDGVGVGLGADCAVADGVEDADGCLVIDAASRVDGAEGAVEAPSAVRDGVGEALDPAAAPPGCAGRARSGEAIVGTPNSETTTRAT